MTYSPAPPQEFSFAPEMSKQDNRTLAEEISKRQTRLENIRKDFDDMYDDVDDYVIGRRSNYDLGSKRGDKAGGKVGAKIYDQTAAMALQDFVDGYQGNSAAPTIDWWSPIFRGSTPGGKLLKGMHETRIWLDDVKEAINAEINNSNFYSQLSEGTWDRATYGYSAIYGPEWSARRNRLIYYLRHPREVFFALNAEGDPDLWHRKFMISGRQIMDLWPDAPFEDTFRLALKTDPYKEYVCIHAIFPRDERDITKITAENKPYASVYMLDGQKTVLEESGMDPGEVPTLARWRATNEAYPRSAAIDAIFTVMMIQQMARSSLRATQLLVEPPQIATGTMKGKLKIQPGGVTFLDNPQDKIEPLKFPSELQAGFMEIKDNREAIAKMFKAEIFSMMSQMKSKITAAQVQAMQGEQATLLQPIVTRDQNENLIPLLKKTFTTLLKAGRLPPPPPSMLDPQVRYTPVDFTFSGPVAMLAKKHVSMMGVNAAVPEILQLIKEQPQLVSMLDKLDPDALYDYIMDSSGAPTIINRDEKLVAQIRQERAKQLQQQQKLEAIDKAAGALQKGAKAPEEGSPSEALMGDQ